MELVKQVWKEAPNFVLARGYQETDSKKLLNEEGT